jgi:hypothetical protein
MVNLKTFTFIARKRQLEDFVNFIYLVLESRAKKKHIFISIRLIFLTFYHTTNLRILLLTPIHFDHISFVFLNTPLVSLIHKVGWFMC